MKLVAALVVGLLEVSTAVAVEVRPAAEAEIVQALQGCWMQEPTFELKQWEARGFINLRQVCFRENAKVETSSVGGDKYELEGLGTDGTYSVAEGKLVMTTRGDFPDGWVFPSPTLSCDVLMSPGKAMRLENCVGDKGEVRAKMSYSRSKQ